MRVDRVLRGKTGSTLQIYEENDSARAGFDWDRGTKYLLFLSYSAQDKAWGLDGCGNSDYLRDSQMALAEIAAIKAAHGGGTIEGMVSEERITNPIPGVHVVATGKTGHYEAITNKGGQFKIAVPPGQYSVDAFKSGMSFEQYYLSYEDSDNVQIEPGGAAQIQFEIKSE